MKRSDFDYFAETIMFKFFEELKQIDSQKTNNKSIDFNRKKLPMVYFNYESFRKDIRKLYMSEESKPMDRHKIAACMMFSILKAKVVKIRRLVPNLPLELLLANEYISFYCAINIIEIYRRDLGFADYSIIFPDTYIEGEGKTSYLENTCKALHYTNSYKISDILLFANTLFMLEKYTDEVLCTKNDKTNS